MQIKNLFYDDTMDCYRPNSADVYSADIPELLASDMDINMFQQQQDHLKEPISYQSAMSAAHMVLDNYSNGSQDAYTNNGSPDSYSNGSQDNYNNSTQSYPLTHHMHEYGGEFPPCTLPSKVPMMDTSVSTLDWLQPLSDGLQHHAITSNSAVMMDPAISAANSDQSVHNQSLTAKILSLPNNVQISGGNVNYVNMPSATQQVFVSSTKCSVGTPPLPECADNGYRSRSNSSSSYVLSPNSAPSSTATENPFPKPAYSYSCLIALALKNSQNGSLPVAEIYSFMMRHFPYFKTAPDGWKNSVRHNLSLNKCFEKIENPNVDGTNSRKGCLWALNPAKVKKMDEEIFKWNKKDPLSIKRAMAHPEVLEILSKGQEVLPLRNAVKRMSNQNRPLPLCTPLQHQPRHQPMHHQQRSPNHSPNMRPVESVTSAPMVHTSAPNGLSCPITSPQQIHCSPQQQHMKQRVNGMEMFANSNNQLCLDSSLSEISIQSGLFDDLPAELLEFQYTYSPTAFLMSPNKSSAPTSPIDEHSTELPAIQSNLPRGTLISLGQN